MEKRSQIKIALTYGAMLGLAAVIVYLLFYFMGADPQSKLPGYISYLFTIVAIVYGVKNYRDQDLNGFITYGRSLGTGVLIGLTSGIISGIFMVLMYTLIDPDLTQKMLDIAQQKMSEKSLTDEQMEMGLKMARKFMSPPFLFIFAVAGTVFMSFIFSLIISIFIKKEQSPFETPSSGAI